MRTITKLFPLVCFVGAVAVQACENVAVDPTGGEAPPAGIIRGSLVYNGPSPCTQNGHVVGNAVILVFDARNPPPPNGLGNTAVNFGVIAGDALFHDVIATEGADKACPSASAPSVQASAPYTVAPLPAGSYVLSAFFDYTGNFFATLKFRQLPEATDVGGGHIDLDNATSLVSDLTKPEQLVNPDGGAATVTYPLREKQFDPNFIPMYLPVNIGTPVALSPTSLRGVPEFAMPATGYVADNVTVTVGATLPLSRPYFYPEGVILPVGQTNANVTINKQAPSTAGRPTTGGKNVGTPQNPSGDVDFVPALSFPQDVQTYAQPQKGSVQQAVVNQYQAAFPQLKLHAGVPPAEQRAGADILHTSDPFHMQLGLPAAGTAPGGNGGIYVWYDGTHTPSDCDGIPDCDPAQLNSIPETSQIPWMWPLVVLAKLDDLPFDSKEKPTNQPNVNDPNALDPQGTDLTKPIVIIQGITLAEDSLYWTALQTSCVSTDPDPTKDGCAGESGSTSATPILAYPDYANHTNLQDHVTVMLRPSVLCMDPRKPDAGGVLVTPGSGGAPIGADGTLPGPFPTADKSDQGSGVIIDSKALSNPQLARFVNTAAVGTTNGLVAGCLPEGRYQINVVYPTGQAWTTPNEEGSCLPLEGETLLKGSGANFLDPGNCSTKPRPVLYSQGTRAVVEITGASNAKNCQATIVPPASSFLNGIKPANYDPKVPFACQALCADANLSPTASPPCSICRDTTLDPGASPPCSKLVAGAKAGGDSGAPARAGDSGL